MTKKSFPQPRRETRMIFAIYAHPVEKKKKFLHSLLLFYPHPVHKKRYFRFLRTLSTKEEVLRT